MIDTIIFNLGGVLIDRNPRYLYRKIFESKAKINDFLAIEFTVGLLLSGKT